MDTAEKYRSLMLVKACNGRGFPPVDRQELRFESEGSVYIVQRHHLRLHS